jgi:hypothetical protein
VPLMSAESEARAAGIWASLRAGVPRVEVPWPRAGRRRDLRDYDQAVVDGVLYGPAGSELVEVDPANLSATQPWLIRPAFDWYLGDTYRRTGVTYADPYNLGNRFPFVYRRAEAGGRPPTSMILTGHHRSAAAWATGRPLLARVVDGPWGPAR